MKYTIFNRSEFDKLVEYQQQHNLNDSEMARLTGISRISYRHYVNNDIDVIRDTQFNKVINFNRTHNL